MIQNNYSDQGKNKSVFENLSKSQQFAVVVLLVLFLGIIIFWIFNFKHRLSSPFVIPEEENTEEQKVVDPRTHDTDGDGLMDYDETNVYHTSIYLEDTDSDGLSDKAEINAGTDPLCPQGQDCNEEKEEIDNIKNLTPPENLDSSNIDQDNLQKLMTGEVDVEMLRKVLIQGGASEEMVNSISDEDLMNIYKQSLEKNNVQQ